MKWISQGVSNTYLFAPVSPVPAVPVASKTSRCIKHIMSIDPDCPSLDAQSNL